MTDQEIDERDMLAFRKLRGEHITKDEQVRLTALNAQLECEFARPMPFPQQVRDALAGLKRLLGRRGSDAG